MLIKIRTWTARRLSACILLAVGCAVIVATARQPEYVRQPASDEERCSSLIVGKDATADGSVILAHNEDLSNYCAQHYIYVPHQAHAVGEMVVTFEGAVVPQAAETYAYMATRIFDKSYVPGDITSGINEHQVAVVNNLSYRRDPPENPSKGRIIWTEFTQFALERARTAREAVQVIGKLASTYKLGEDSGTIFGIIDPNEGWWVEVTQEGQWAAQKVPSNTAGFRANIFRIGVVAFDDPDNFMYSEDLVSYAQSQGWYQSGPFDFTKIYADPDKVASQYNRRRQWRAENLLKPWVDAGSVKPDQIISLWRDHYEGTDYDLTRGYTKGSPHQTDERTLCSINTELSVICQSRGWLPADIGAVCWRAMATPCTSIYTPWYLGSREVLKEYQTGASQFARGSAYWTFRRLALSVDIRYQEAIDEVRRERLEFEKKELESAASVEKTALLLYKEDPRKAFEYLAKYSSRMAKEAMEKGDNLIRFCDQH